MNNIIKYILYFLIGIIMLGAVIGFVYLTFGDVQFNNACKSIGYDKVAYSGREKYCVNSIESVKVAFANCGFDTCEVYKIK